MYSKAVVLFCIAAVVSAGNLYQPVPVSYAAYASAPAYARYDPLPTRTLGPATSYQSVTRHDAPAVKTVVAPVTYASVPVTYASAPVTYAAPTVTPLATHLVKTVTPVSYVAPAKAVSHQSVKLQSYNPTPIVKALPAAAAYPEPIITTYSSAPVASYSSAPAISTYAVPTLRYSVAPASYSLPAAPVPVRYASAPAVSSYSVSPSISRYSSAVHHATPSVSFSSIAPSVPHSPAPVVAYTPAPAVAYSSVPSISYSAPISYAASAPIVNSAVRYSSAPAVSRVSYSGPDASYAW